LPQVFDSPGFVACRDTPGCRGKPKKAEEQGEADEFGKELSRIGSAKDHYAESPSQRDSAKCPEQPKSSVLY
jgi:hypothetical protein